MKLRTIAIASLTLVACKKADPAATTGSGSGSGSAGSAAATAPSVDAAPKAAPQFATPEAKLKRFAECWDAVNTGKDEVFTGCFGDGADREQVDGVPETVAHGRSKILEAVKLQKAAFPDLKITPQLVIVSGNDIAAVLHVTGTNTGEVTGMKVTKKKIGLFEAEVVTLSDEGTISRDAFYIDQPTIYTQLGLLENPNSPKAADAVAGKLEELVSKNDATETANKELVKKLIAAVNKKDAAGIEALAAPDIKLVSHGDKTKIADKAAYMKWFKETLASTTDGKVEIQTMWAAGDVVVVADTFSGSPTKEAAGSDAADKHVEVHELELFRIADGKIKQHQIFTNQLKMAVQLGMIDPDALMEQISASATGSGSAQ